MSQCLCLVSTLHCLSWLTHRLCLVLPTALRGQATAFALCVSTALRGQHPAFPRGLSEASSLLSAEEKTELKRQQRCGQCKDTALIKKIKCR